MGAFPIATALAAVLIISSISFVTCNPSKRQVVIGTAEPAEPCIVDPGKENRTILLEGAATTWAATLPPMLATLQEMSETMKLERCAYKPSEPMGMDCSTLYAQGHNTSGIHKIGAHAHSVEPHEPFDAYCDMETDGGGWTVFQKRFDGSTTFYRGWEEYVNGFGHLNGEQWLGLKKVNLLTSFAKYEMRIDLERFNGEMAYAKYANFQVGDEIDEYQLTVSEYSGTAGDALSRHNAKKFSTKDRDNDNCAHLGHGAWWYYGARPYYCHQSNLNGQYLGAEFNSNGMVWKTWQQNEGLKAAAMKMRRKN